MEPGRAFDAISKILFIKMYIERTGAWGTFTTDYLDQRKAVSLPTDKPVHEQLFDQTKKHYENSEIFSGRDELEVSEETFRRIVKELARFNLSATGEDIKGLAFEQFLGTTFRGELGMFFTPRPIVDFAVRLLDPKENDLICDPAAGSGGFLIRAFEHVRDKISDDIQAKKDAFRTAMEAKHLKEEEETRQIEEAFIRFNRELDPEQTNPPSRVRKLAYDCIFGTDAEPRAARTAKMNMIMHGDGHGGIHYHDGLVDINGVFAGRFDLVLTNPPLGQNVGDDQKFGGSEETRVPNNDTYRDRCRERYGEDWEASHERTLKFASGKPDAILEAFEIGKDKPNRPTEILFLERCIQLLRPGGRMGIVLPDGNLNNPSLSWLRRWAESKARLLAVVSLPEETFRSADATVKASLVFLQRFTESDGAAWEDAWQRAHAKYDALHNADRSRLCSEYGPRIASAENPDVAGILHELATIGVHRQLPDWKQAEPPLYPRGVGMTMVGGPRWIGETTDKKRARELKQQFQEAWSEDVARNADTILRELRASLRKVDKAHNTALWHEVRELFDYPVFTAAPETVGITSTGADGPNQLPDVLIAYRKFDTWVDSGAKPDQIPEFGV